MRHFDFKSVVQTLIKNCCICAVVFISISAEVLAQATYWWNDAVFYEVFVRSFKDHDGDGQGDLKGLIEKLDYLNDGNPDTHNDLGVNALWLMPIQQSPSYHGYDVTDYRTVEEDYGTNQDFKDLIQAAHSRGIKVIIDLVMNHTSSQHPWFTNSHASLDGKRDWYVWENPKPSMTGPWSQPVWHTKSTDNHYYGIFWSEMPDLNYNTPEVKEEMFDIARFWLEDMNVDGFRLDAVKYIYEEGSVLEDLPSTIQFWKDFRVHYKDVKPDAFAVGEAWTTTDKVAPYANDGALDYCFEFDLATAIINSVNNANVTNVNALKDQMEEVIATYPFLQYGTFLTNHDINRAMSQFNNVAKNKLAAHLLLTLPGVPYIYYGEEIGMTGINADENKRTPMQWDNGTQAGFSSGTPWRAVNADYTSKNVKAQQADANSLWNVYKKLITLRNHQAALRKGSYLAVTSSANSVYSFLRQYEEENILVVSNMAATAANTIQLSLSGGDIAPGEYLLVDLKGGSQLPITIDNDGNFANLTIATMPARSTSIYKFMPAGAVTTTNILFKVDMNAMINAGHFNPTTETVNIFNDFGLVNTTMVDDDNDGIYTLEVPSIGIGSIVSYKYRINDADDGREEISSRDYLVVEGANVVANQYERDLSTGVENVLKRGIVLYPMPVQTELNIQYSEQVSGKLHYNITDLTGNSIVSSSFWAEPGNGYYQIPCEELVPGFYLLNLSLNGIKQTFKIIIQ